MANFSAYQRNFMNIVKISISFAYYLSFSNLS